MSVRILVFAVLRDLLGCAEVVIETNGPVTVGALRTILTQQHPNVAGTLERSVFAVNQQFATNSTVIAEGAEVAIIPPVSGG